MRKILIILGIPIDDLSMDAALNRLEEFVAVGRATGKTHQIATVNADFVVKAIDDPELRWILQESDMATADGMPLVWGARLLGVPLEGRVTGADLVPALAERAARNGYSIYLLGGAPGVAQNAAQILQTRYPGLNIVGVFSPPVSSILEMDENIAQRIRQAKPDILLVAFGNPKQEKWINMHARTLAVPVMIGVGGTLDFIAGVTKRAPKWMQKTGMEWVFRLAQEPRRLWKRYVVDFGGFGIFFVRQWLLMRGKSLPATIVPQNDIVLVEGQLVVNLVGRLDGGNAESFHRKIIQALNDLGRTPRLIINLANAQFIDSRGLGVLVAIAKMTRDNGSDMRLAATPNAIANTFKLMRVDTFFQQFKDVPSALAGEDQPSSSTSVPNTSTWSIIPMPRRLDAATSPQVSEACETQIKQNPRLVLDLATTVFLSSAGLGMLVKLEKLAQSMGGEIRLANCSRDVVRSLELGRMEMVVKWFPSLEAAMR